MLFRSAATWDFEFRTSFSRGNICFILAVTFRARLFLFPVPSSPRQIRIFKGDTIWTPSKLIADDDAGMRLVMRRLVEQAEGYALVGEASDGAELIHLYDELQPEVVLLTAVLALSGFGGSGVVRSLRSGLESLEARLGADIIVMPATAESKEIGRASCRERV